MKFLVYSDRFKRIKVCLLTVHYDRSDFICDSFKLNECACERLFKRCLFVNKFKYVCILSLLLLRTDSFGRPLGSASLSGF